MTDRDIEVRLAEAIRHAAPDRLEQILSQCNDQEGAVIAMNEKKTRKPIHRWKIWAGAAAAALLLAVGLWVIMLTMVLTPSLASMSIPV